DPAFAYVDDAAPVFAEIGTKAAGNIPSTLSSRRRHQEESHRRGAADPSKMHAVLPPSRMICARRLSGNFECSERLPAPDLGPRDAAAIIRPSLHTTGIVPWPF